MSDFIKNECYKFYKKYKELGIAKHAIPKEEIEEFLKEKQISEDEYLAKMNRIDYLLSAKNELDSFGIELEYAGRNNACNQNNVLTEESKFDGSVAGDGREWTLKPQPISRIRNDTYKKELESWMVTAINHGCLIHQSAGNHIHLGCWADIDDYDEDYEEYCTPRTDTIVQLGNATRLVFLYAFVQENIYDENSEIIPWETRKRVTKKLHEDMPEKIKKCYEAAQFLYAVSNRNGSEDYGLARDGTRGYTRHNTVEIRAFRTTTDYRSVIARTIVSKFFVEWCIYAKLVEEEFMDWEEVPSIWSELEKMENSEVKNMYKYLAFHCTNKHHISLTKDELCTKLGVTKAYANAISKRSLLINKALQPNSPEERAKNLFKF